MTLHIIGNGFDLFHGMNTLYSDFCDFAWKNAKGRGYFLGMLETVYPNTNINTGRLELWSNLEKALGEPDFQAAFKVTTEDIEIEEEHEIRYQPQMEDAPTYYLGMMFDAFHNLFREWVESIEIADDKMELPHFDSHGLFFSFNYTETLEVVYKIPSSNINYIHGRRNTANELIVGHCNDLYGDEHIPEEPMVYEYQGYDNIAEIINKERKNVSDILESNTNYWNTLKAIDKIVVYGHSLSDVDMPYFRKIASNIQQNSKWYFSIHYNNPSERDFEVKKIRAFISELKLDIDNCQTFSL